MRVQTDDLHAPALHGDRGQQRGQAVVGKVDRRDVLDGLVDVAGRDEQAYAARVRLVDGEVQLITSTPREELAPLVKEPAP